MLNAGDIVYMHETQDEIYTLRQRPIDVIYLDEQYDDFTGELIGSMQNTRAVQAVVTELSINSVNGSRYVEGGIEYEQGDIKADFKREYIEDIADKITQLYYEGKRYEILGDDRKGIGVRNRYELLGRVIA